MTAPADSNASIPAKSEAGRLTGVLIDPKPAFRDIAANPRWWPPLVILILLTLIYMTAFTQHVGWERMMRQQMETNSRLQNLPAEQRENIVQRQVRIAPVFGYAGAVVGVPISALITAAVLLFLCRTVLGADLRFRQVFAISAYAFMTGVVSLAVSMVVMFLKNPDDFNLRNPIGFNIGAYLDPQSTPKFLESLATSIDLFSIWTILLLATGLSAADRRLPFAKALMGVLIPWGAWVLLKSGGASLFG